MPCLYDTYHRQDSLFPYAVSMLLHLQIMCHARYLQARCACLIRVAQLQLGPAFCQVDGFRSQVPGRQVGSVSSEAGATVGQADGESRSLC